ncbi:exonuclease domain-containing protein, partial [Melaminivora sp.]
MTDTLPPTAPTLAKSDQNLVWLDCEMSGLDPEKERLLEIAVV